MTEKRECIHCGKCTEQCEFLKKYQLKICDIEKLNRLAYHCFLCGRCDDVCPVGNKGTEIILNLRRKQIQNNNGEILEQGYEMLIKEKADYMFRNYKNVTSGMVLFPGCSFPSFFPETTKYLSGFLKKEYGIGTIYDCCGKPIRELGLREQEEQIIMRMMEQFKEEDIREIIMLCPNCYYYLRDKLAVKVTSIFEFLSEKKIGKKIGGKSVPLFIPCPEKKEKIWLHKLQDYLNDNGQEVMDLQCCGLGGCARGKEPEIAKSFTEQMQKKYAQLYTYCGSCAGKFGRDGMKNIHHVLPAILGIDERPDIENSMQNRAMSKEW